MEEAEPLFDPSLSCPISHLHSAALHTYFKDAIGLGPEADGTAKANAIIEEGIDMI